MRLPKPKIVPLTQRQLCELMPPGHHRDRLFEIARREFTGLGGELYEDNARGLELLRDNFLAAQKPGADNPLAWNQPKTTMRDGLRAIHMLAQHAKKIEQLWEQAFLFARERLYDETGIRLRPRMEARQAAEPEIAPAADTEPAHEVEAVELETEPTPQAAEPAPRPAFGTNRPALTGKRIKQMVRSLEARKVKRELREEFRQAAKSGSFTIEQLQQKMQELVAA